MGEKKVVRFKTQLKIDATRVALGKEAYAVRVPD
jgi:hypothetical protein